MDQEAVEIAERIKDLIDAIVQQTKNPHTTSEAYVNRVKQELIEAIAKSRR